MLWLDGRNHPARRRERLLRVGGALLPGREDLLGLDGISNPFHTYSRMYIESRTRTRTQVYV